MVKASTEELLDAVADDFHTYLRRGVRFDQVIGSAHAELNIDDIETLLRIHFVLTETKADGEVGVVNFVRELEDRVRRVKTTTAPQSQEYRGEVRGRIDWQKTVKSRARRGRLDEPVFVCSEPEEHYNIDENIVLKRLLTVIYEIVTEDLEYARENPEGYEWLSAWTSSIGDPDRHAESATEVLERVYERNVYLQRIDVEEDAVTERMIESVKRSRSAFYREAAELLGQYRQLMRHELDTEEAREILNHTLIAPEKAEELFELYWVFSVLNEFDSAQYRVLADWRDRSSAVAEWEQKGSRYVLSHNSTGEALTFRERIADETIEPDGYLYRLSKVLEEWNSLSEELLGRGQSDSLWGGRPDIVLERFEQDEDGEWMLDDVLIGEVKYTQDVEYAATGLRELLEYMAFVRHADESGEYVEETEHILESVAVRGLLFTDDLDHETGETSDGVRLVEYPDSPNL